MAGLAGAGAGGFLAAGAAAAGLSNGTRIWARVGDRPRGAAAALLVLALALGELLKEKRPRRRSTLRERRFFFLSCGHLSTSSFCSIGQPAYRPRMALLFSLWFGHALTSSQSSSGPRDESGEGWSPCYSCEAKTFASMSMRLC